MALLTHNALLRAAELIALTVGDVEWTSADRSSCRLRIVHSKSNQFGPPELVPLEAYSDISVVTFLRHTILSSILVGLPAGQYTSVCRRASQSVLP
jgi:hypothetical protein